MTRVIGLAVAALLLGSACSGGSTTAAPSSPASVSPSPSAASTPESTTAALGPCDLLTTAEVSAALGVQVSDGKATDQGPPLGGHECFWATPAPPILTFQVVLRTSPDLAASGQRTSDLYQSTVAAFTTTQGLSPVSGIADSATIGAEYAYVLKGDVYLTAAIGARGQVDEATALLGLTKSAAGKL